MYVSEDFSCYIKQKRAYERRISDWSSDVCSSDLRSLRDFGEAPIDVLADRVDLIVVDHPFSGRAQASGCLIDLKPHLSRAEIDAMLADKIGRASSRARVCQSV